MSAPLDPVRMRGVMKAARQLVAELDLEAVFEQLLATARELTGARYAALGIINEQRTELERFVTHGIDTQTQLEIGKLPRGHGVLGILINDPQPLRLADIGDHPESYGFPARHPVMRSFLGVPIMIRDRSWGNLYLTEKDGGDFTEADEEVATILADWAAIAIENGRTYTRSEARRGELEKALRSLEATRDITTAIGSETGLERVLEVIAKRGRALVEARTLLIMLRDDDDLVVTVSVGYAEEKRGKRLAIAGSTCGAVLERGRPEQVNEAAARMRISPTHFGVTDAHAALLVPMLHRGTAVGVLAAFDRGADAGPFREEDEQALVSFATSAATAVALAQSVQTDRLRDSLAAAEAERARWARELHDETLQGLGGLRVLLAAGLRRGEPHALGDAAREAVGHIELEIANLRALITELRPAALDALGLRPALDGLLDRYRERQRLEIDASIELCGGTGAQKQRSDALETTIYRIVQESLTNVARHANAQHVRVEIAEGDSDIVVSVVDDGAGFDASAASGGFGLLGMRERVELAGGNVEIESSDAGTQVRARIPLRPVRARGLPQRPSESVPVGTGGEGAVEGSAL